jgi:hypothetical protein
VTLSPPLLRRAKHCEICCIGRFGVRVVDGCRLCLCLKWKMWKFEKNSTCFSRETHPTTHNAFPIPLLPYLL